MNIFQQIKFALSRPPRSQIKFIMTTYIDNVISKRFYGKSLTGNFLQIIYSIMTQADGDFAVSGAPWSSAINSKDVNGTSRATHNLISFRQNVSAGDLTAGLILGTGTTTPAADDYTIETVIPHGTGSGQLSYQNMAATQGCEIVGLVTSLVLQRLFVNSSGAQIDVNEIALYSKQTTYVFCIYRDVLSSADEIPNGSTYRVTLEMSVTT